MNTLNRLIVILLLLSIIVLTLVTVVIPWRVAALLTLNLQGVESSLAQFQFPTMQWWTFALFRAAVAVLVVAIAGLLLWLEIRRPRAKTVRVHKVGGAEVLMSADAVARRLQYNLDQLPDIVEVKPFISGRRGSVDVQLHLTTKPDIDIPAKSAEIEQLVRNIIEEQMGLQLAGKPKIRLDYVTYPSDEIIQRQVQPREQPATQQITQGQAPQRPEEEQGAEKQG
jgi:hypothetical protein